MLHLQRTAAVVSLNRFTAVAMEPGAETVTAGKKERRKKKHENVHRNFSNHSSGMGISDTASMRFAVCFFRGIFSFSTEVRSCFKPPVVHYSEDSSQRKDSLFQSRLLHCKNCLTLIFTRDYTRPDV